MRKIKKFLTPKNIAVIGASEHTNKVGGVLMEKLLTFDGEVIPINKNHEIIFKKKSYPSVLDYSEKIDLAVIAIPAVGVEEVLIECGKKKIENVIIITAGFSEIGNKKSEDEIIKIGKEYGMNILGPNCFGIVNPSIKLDTTFSNLSAKEGDIAFISQSGALWSYIADISASEKKLGFSAFISLGNMGDLGFSDFIEYFNNDEKTKKIILYIEKLKDGRKFLDVCKKSKKEIIVIKSGRTKTGSEATLSHTGSLATDFEIYKGLFRQIGIKINNSLAESFGIKKSEIEPKGKKIAIVTNAGGAGALVTDYLVEKGYSVNSPIDVLGTAVTEDYKKVFDSLKKSKEDSIIAILTPQRMSTPEEVAKELVDLSKHKEVIGIFLGANSIKKAKNILEKNKIPCFTNI